MLTVTLSVPDGTVGGGITIIQCKPDGGLNLWTRAFDLQNASQSDTIAIEQESTNNPEPKEVGE